MKKSPLKKFLFKLAFAGLILLFTNSSFSQTSPVTNPLGGFKIDGYLRANTPAGAAGRFGDWVPQVNNTPFGGVGVVDSFVLSSAGVPRDNVTTRRQEDLYSNNSDNVFTQGSKFADTIGSLHWGLSGAPDKNDIHNGVFHASADNATPAHQWVFIGGDRLSTSGTSYIDFQFLQGTITTNASTFSGSGPHGGRTEGDMNISMEYTNGGSAPKVVIYRWIPANEAHTNWTWDSTGSSLITQAYAKTNLVTVDVPFGAFGATTYQPYAFVEAAIDITQVISLASGNCSGLTIKTLWITTKASASSTAALKDFMTPISLNLNFGSVTIDAKGPFCVNASSITLTGSPSGGTFTGPGTSGANGATFTPATAGVGTHTIVYSASAGANCTKTASMQIVVNANPSVTDPTDQVVCNGASTTAFTFSSPVAGATFAWTNDNTSIGLAASGSSNIDAFTAVNTGTSNAVANLTVTATANGCSGSPQQFTITVKPTPTVTDPTDQLVCNGASTTAVTFSGAVTGTTFAWTNTNTSIGLGASGSGTINAFTATNSGTTSAVATITVTPTANSCAGPQQQFTITVKPTPTVTDPSDQSVCNGVSTTAVNFTGAVAGTTFAWTNTNTSIGLGASGSGNIGAFTATNSGTTNAVATITITPTANSCAGSQQSFTITVKPTPTVADPSDQTLCNGVSTNAVNFTGAVAGTTFAWTNTNTSIGLGASGSGNISAFTASNSGTTNAVATITVTPTADGCPGTPQSFTITVKPTPTVSDPADQSLCKGASTNAVNFSGAVAGTVYSWTNTTTSIGLGSSGNGNIASFVAQNSGASNVTATITVTPTADGCAGTPQTFTITVYAQPAAPTICVVQPTLCGPSTGSITVLSPTGPGYQYSKDGGTNWQSEVTFNNLAAGSNPSIIVKSPQGCISSATSCSSGSACVQSQRTTTVTQAEATAKVLGSATLEGSSVTVSAMPNPFSNKVRFMITNPEAGKGILEIYNMAGQKIKTVYDGNIPAGVSYFDLTLATKQVANHVYVLRIGDKKMTGKILQINH
jgi:hypothetical protein